MPFLSKESLLERLRTDAINSSHYVWLFADLKYYQCQNGWIFAYLQKGSITLIALEPLIPGAPMDYNAEHGSAFKEAWKEFSECISIQTAAFISVYDPFLKILHREGFKSIKVGEEPWVDLNDCIPTGNVGKGVRSARNQAILAGLKVEEWSAEEISNDVQKRTVLREIYQEWKSRNLVNLGGFLNAIEPFQAMEDRRYFILKSPSRIEAFLTATPVPGIQSYFLEDILIRNHVPKGASELLTLEAMVALKEGSTRSVSLGVISMTTLEPKKTLHLPNFIRFLLGTIPRSMSLIYNFNGMEVYRKRFKPQRWQNVNVAVKNVHSTCSETMLWLKVFFALLVAFKPRLQPSLRWIKKTCLTPIQKYPVTLVVSFISFILYAKMNQFSVLPDWALTRFCFFAEAPLYQWIYRSVVSNLLYFDTVHILSTGIGLSLVLFWTERTQRRKFLIFYLIFCFLLSDSVNYWLVIMPFRHIQPSLFDKLIKYNDVGGSLILTNLIGLQLCQFRMMREQTFSFLILTCILGFALSSVGRVSLIINLNHTVFLILGYLVGKMQFEYHRHQSRLASKGKPPLAKSVLVTKKSLKLG